VSDDGAAQGRAEQIALLENSIRQSEDDARRLESSLRDTEEVRQGWRDLEWDAIPQQEQAHAERADDDASLNALRQEVDDGKKPGRLGRPPSRGASDTGQEQIESRERMALMYDELLRTEDEQLARCRERIADLAVIADRTRANLDQARTTIEKARSLLAVLRTAED